MIFSFIPWGTGSGVSIKSKCYTPSVCSVHSEK